ARAPPPRDPEAHDPEQREQPPRGHRAAAAAVVLAVGELRPLVVDHARLRVLAPDLPARALLGRRAHVPRAARVAARRRVGPRRRRALALIGRRVARLAGRAVAAHPAAAVVTARAPHAGALLRHARALLARLTGRTDAAAPAATV